MQYTKSRKERKLHISRIETKYGVLTLCGKFFSKNDLVKNPTTRRKCSECENLKPILSKLKKG